MKKLLALFLTVALVAALFVGCGNSTSTTSSSTSGKIKIYLITMDQTDQHWVNLDKGCQQAVSELGNIDYKWIAPDQKDDAKQIECINNAVADGAQAILLAANGPDSVTDALNNAISKGVKIIYVDSAANVAASASFMTDNKAAGKTAGEQLLAAFKEKGITSGKIGIIGVSASTNSTVNRETGFREAFAGSAFTLLDTQYGNGDAAASKEIASNYITQGVVGIFGSNEGSTVGTGNAIKEASSKVIGVGFDKSDSILELIREGYLLCAMAQNPDQMGLQGLKAAVKAVKGETITQTSVDTGVSVLTKDNI